MLRISKINYLLYRILEGQENYLPLITCPVMIRSASPHPITSKRITIFQRNQVARGTGGDKRKQTGKNEVRTGVNVY